MLVVKLIPKFNKSITPLMSTPLSLKGRHIEMILPSNH